MKKRFAAIFLIAAMVLALPAYAATARVAVVQPGLSFTGTKANCSLVVLGDLGNESIEATIKLARGTTELATWHVEAVGELVFSNSTVTAPKGGTYTLTANVEINGRTYAPVSRTATNN